MVGPLGSALGGIVVLWIALLAHRARFLGSIWSTDLRLYNISLDHVRSSNWVKHFSVTS